MCLLEIILNLIKAIIENGEMISLWIMLVRLTAIEWWNKKLKYHNDILICHQFSVWLLQEEAIHWVSQFVHSIEFISISSSVFIKRKIWNNLITMSQRYLEGIFEFCTKFNWKLFNLQLKFLFWVQSISSVLNLYILKWESNSEYLKNSW